MINRQVERIQTPLSLLWLAWSKATAVTWPCPRLWKEGGTVYILAIALIRGKEHPALGELSKSIWLHRFYHERFVNIRTKREDRMIKWSIFCSFLFFMWPVHLCLVRTYSDTVTCFCADHTLTSLPKSPMETKSPRKTVAEGSVRCDVNQILWQQRFAEICREGWQHVGLLSCINSLMQDKSPCYRGQKGSASTSGLFWSLLKPVSGVIQITKYPPNKTFKNSFHCVDHLASICLLCSYQITQDTRLEEAAKNMAARCIKTRWFLWGLRYSKMLFRCLLQRNLLDQFFFLLTSRHLDISWHS